MANSQTSQTPGKLTCDYLKGHIPKVSYDKPIKEETQKQKIYYKFENKHFNMLMQAIIDKCHKSDISSYMVTMCIEKDLIPLTKIFSYASWKNMALDKTSWNGWKCY